MKIRDSVRKMRSPAALGVALFLAATAFAAGCQRPSGYLQLEGATMGTYYRVTARCPDSEPVQLQQTLSEELLTVNAQMSTYDADSELMRFNRSQPGIWVPVSADLVGVLAAALEISELSDGAFDPTVARLVSLWGFGPEGPVTEPPDSATVNAALAEAGFQKLEVDPANGAVRRMTPLSVDLSAIAKGHGVDRLSERLRQMACSDFLVDIGGEVRAQGQNAQGRIWRVGVEVPDPTRMGSIQRVLVLEDVAVATSGDYRNFIDLEGERYSHTIDPRTGYPVRHTLASVTVIHPSAMWADGLATALNVLGPESGFELAEQQGLAALFLIRGPNGFEERYTPNLLIHLAK